MILLHQLSKVYRTDLVETTALSPVDLEVQRGEFLSIMGPSGCGKSTLLNLIGLIDSPSTGSYQFLGQEVAQHGERRRAQLRKQHIGFVFQSFNLIDELTVCQNVALPMVYAKVSASERQQRAEAALDRMGMMNRRNHYPAQLSGGQQQRVAVARAIVNQPELILADEPTGNLDTANGDEVMALLSALHQQGATVVMVTHSPTAAQYGDRTVHLLDGKILGETMHT